ncbi:MAG TPA: hypothetical protein VHV57_01940 [Acidimicrobiales bacterium]|jgi:hypothetical protein|nr:hypothetical protein [Acidimicrobiales bacterium]
MKRSAAVVLAALVGLGLAGCAGEDQRGTSSHRMTEWVGGTGFGEDIGTLLADNARVPEDVPNGDGAVHAACGTLEDDAEMANDELPTPDQQVTDWLSTAYGLEGTAGVECYQAGSTDKALLAKSARATAKAKGLIERSLVRIQSIDSKVVSTTTTTDNSGGIFG